MSRWNESLCERHAEEDSRYFIVRRPTAHEGIGRALRSVYHQQDNSLPPEMRELLGKLGERARNAT